MIKPEARRGIYWTNVSINTKVWGLDPMSRGFDAVSSAFVSSGVVRRFAAVPNFSKNMIFELRVIGTRSIAEGYGQAPVGDSSREPRSIAELMKA